MRVLSESAQRHYRTGGNNLFVKLNFKFNLGRGRVRGRGRRSIRGRCSSVGERGRSRGKNLFV